MLLQAPRGHCVFVMSAAIQIIQYRLGFGPDQHPPPATIEKD